jgi:thymidylate kinase
MPYLVGVPSWSPREGVGAELLGGDLPGVVEELSPTGREVRLAADPEATAALARVLVAAGFAGGDGRWVRIEGATVQLVDVVPRDRVPGMEVRRGTHRRAIIALSGLDGAGKSSHAELLTAALAELGITATSRWTRFGENRSLEAIAAPIKRLLRGRRRPESSAPPSDEGPPSLDDPATALRSRNALITHVWATVVAVANARRHRQATRDGLRSADVVICDRYVLDSIVQLRDRYGPSRRLGGQARLIRLLSPKPLAAFYFDITPETALARKADWFGIEELRQQAALYREELGRLGVSVIPGEGPRDEVAADLILAVWRRLRPADGPA